MSAKGCRAIMMLRIKSSRRLYHFDVILSINLYTTNHNDDNKKPAEAGLDCTDHGLCVSMNSVTQAFINFAIDLPDSSDLRWISW